MTVDLILADDPCCTLSSQLVDPSAQAKEKQGGAI